MLCPRTAESRLSSYKLRLSLCLCFWYTCNYISLLLVDICPVCLFLLFYFLSCCVLWLAVFCNLHSMFIHSNNLFFWLKHSIHLHLLQLLIYLHSFLWYYFVLFVPFFSLLFLFFFSILFFWPCHVAYEVLVPPTRSEPAYTLCNGSMES